jgi:hypothetical protein
MITCVLFGLFFEPEDSDNVFLKNISKVLPGYMALYPKRQHYTYKWLVQDVPFYHKTFSKFRYINTEVTYIHGYCYEFYSRGKANVFCHWELNLERIQALCSHTDGMPNCWQYSALTYPHWRTSTLAISATDFQLSLIQIWKVATLYNVCFCTVYPFFITTTSSAHFFPCVLNRGSDFSLLKSCDTVGTATS